MLTRSKRALALWASFGCVMPALLSSCSSGSDHRPPAGTGALGSSDGDAGESGGGRDAGNNGGKGSGSDEPGAGGTPTDSAGTSAGGEPTSEGGAAGADGEGGAAPVDSKPRDGSCTGQRAFTALAGSFVSPTEAQLARALNDAIFGIAPITIALLNDGESPRVAASYSKESAGRHAFHPGIAPEPTLAWVKGEAFGTDAAQAHGYLLLDTTSGALELPLDNLSYSVTTSEGCSKGVVTLTGVIPASRADLVQQLTGSDSDDAEGGSGGAGNDEDRDEPVDTAVSAIFSVELVDFDFGSVP